MLRKFTWFQIFLQTTAGFCFAKAQTEALGAYVAPREHDPQTLALSPKVVRYLLRRHVRPVRSAE